MSDEFTAQDLPDEIIVQEVPIDAEKELALLLVHHYGLKPYFTIDGTLGIKMTRLNISLDHFGLSLQATIADGIDTLVRSDGAVDVENKRLLEATRVTFADCLIALTKALDGLKQLQSKAQSTQTLDRNKAKENSK